MGMRCCINKRGDVPRKAPDKQLPLWIDKPTFGMSWYLYQNTNCSKILFYHSHSRTRVSKEGAPQYQSQESALCWQACSKGARNTRTPQPNIPGIQVFFCDCWLRSFVFSITNGASKKSHDKSHCYLHSPGSCAHCWKSTWRILDNPCQQKILFLLVPTCSLDMLLEVRSNHHCIQWKPCNDAKKNKKQRHCLFFVNRGSSGEGACSRVGESLEMWRNSLKHFDAEILEETT